MKVLVTGAAGRMGHVTCAYLNQKGYEVRAIDVADKSQFSAEAAKHLAHAEYQQVDVRDYEAVAKSCQNIDAIVHLAGIPLYIEPRSVDIFQINAGGSFNVFQAAAKAGVEHIVAASSINYLGNGFGRGFIDIQYFPIDEEHPGYTTDTYAFSKQMLEDIAAYFWRQAELSSICFRFPLVYGDYWFSDEIIHHMWQKNHNDFEMLMALPETKRATKVQALKDLYLQLRYKRNQGGTDYSPVFQVYTREPGAMLLFGLENFWSGIDVWDAARAMERGLQVSIQGSYPIYLCEPENLTGLPSRDLAALFYPDVKEWKRPCPGTTTLLNSEKAASLLKYTPNKTLNEGLP